MADRVGDKIARLAAQARPGMAIFRDYFAHQQPVARGEIGGLRIGKSAALERALEVSGLAAQKMRTAVDTLHRNGHDTKIVGIDEAGHIDKHMMDAMLYGQSVSRIHRPEKTLDDYSDAELVMDMIRRGFAVMKLPADGGPPESLR